MAQRRMFSLKVIDTDAFLDMPQTTQLLYYNLAMRADDDGFVANPKRIIRMAGSSDDDLKILIAKKYIIPFEKGICVIRHWRIHNYIQKDRYTPTEYTEELKQLDLKNGKYEKDADAMLEHGKQNVSKMYTQDRLELGKVRKGKSKDRIGKDSNMVKKIIEEWNEKTKDTPLPALKTITGSRWKHLKERINEKDFTDNFSQIIDSIIQSDFLSGRKPSKTHPNFKADFDWLIKNDTNYIKILEGKYKTEKGEDDERRKRLDSIGREI